MLFLLFQLSVIAEGRGGVGSLCRKSPGVCFLPICQSDEQEKYGQPG